MNTLQNISNRTSVDWQTITTGEFWNIADRVQEETLDEAHKIFSYLETATPLMIRLILTQYRYFTVYYIPDLALLVARMNDGSLKSFLADILYDELGCGKAEGAHPQLYDEFLYSIGVENRNLDGDALERNITLLDEARRRLVDANNRNEYAIGLRGMGGECVCQVYIAELFKCLIKNPFIQENKSRIDWRFWDLHVGEHDIDHRERTRAMIDTEIVAKGGEGLKQLGAGYGYSMESWREFWVNIFNLQYCDGNDSRFNRTTVKSFVNVKICDGSSCPTKANLALN